MDRENPKTVETTLPIEHPDLGPATAYLDDKRLTRRAFWLSFLWIAVGILGVVMGDGDANGGDNLGYFFIFGGVVLILYGLAEVRTAAMRMRRPIRLVVSDAGFEYADGPGPIDWDEVQIADYESTQRNSAPIGIRIRVRSAEGFIERRPTMTRSARRSLVSNQSWMRVGGGFAAPLSDVLAVFKQHVPGGRLKPPAAKQAGARSSDEPDQTAEASKRRADRTSRH